MIAEEPSKEEDGFDMDDFLKQGGINVDEAAEEAKAEEQEENKAGGESEVVKYNTDADEKMCGYLVKSSMKMPGSGGGDDILGMVVKGIGNGMKMGFKLFTETIQIKQTKKYFAIKHGVLYWYSHERAREAQKQLEIKQLKAIEINKENPKEFYIIVRKKCYRLRGAHEGEA